MRRILMHVGPSVGSYEVLLKSVKEDVGFGSPEFVEAMRSALEGVRYVMGADNSFTPFIIPGSGTSAMEAVTTFLREGDRVLVASNGLFGDRWRSILERYPVKVDYIGSEPGRSISAKSIQEIAESKHYRMSFFTQVETSTGVRAPVPELVKEMKKVSEFVALDGVAAVGGEESCASKWGIDYYVTASQKAIGAPPGAGISTVSGRLMENIPERSVSGYSLDLSNWKRTMESFLDGKGSYFATPPVHVILSLDYALRLAREETMDKRVRRHIASRDQIVEGIEEMGFETVAEPGLRSSTVTGVLTGKISPGDLLAASLRRGVEFAPGVHPALAGRYFRIGHMGWITEKDAAIAVHVLRGALKEVS